MGMIEKLYSFMFTKRVREHGHNQNQTTTKMDL